MLSDRGLPDFPRLYRSVRCCLLLVQKHRPVPTFNYFPAQSLHFRYGSAAPYPTLRADVTTLLPRTRYGRLATPYPTGLPCCVLPAYKDCSRSQWKTAYAVFSVRTITSIVLLFFINARRHPPNLILRRCRFRFDPAFRRMDLSLLFSRELLLP